MTQSTSPSAPLYDASKVVNLLTIDSGTEMARILLIGSQKEGQAGFISFVDPGWSILHLRNSVASKGIFYRQTWHDDQSFAKLEEQPRYRQLRMEAVKDSFAKTFAEQQALLPPDEEIPTARVVLMGMAIHFLATGVRLFSDYYVRCADQTSGGDLVGVGDFDPDGVGVDDWEPDSPRDDLGLASSRKF